MSELEIDADSTAVLITDPQIDFLKPESVVWDKVGETVEENAVVDKLRRLRDAARSAVFVVDPDREIQYAWRSEETEDEPDLSAVEHAARCHGDECELPDGKSYL